MLFLTPSSDVVTTTTLHFFPFLTCLMFVFFKHSVVCDRTCLQTLSQEDKKMVSCDLQARMTGLSLHVTVPVLFKETQGSKRCAKTELSGHVLLLPILLQQHHDSNICFATQRGTI